jgi:DeoR family fructose operon transcriptional repressor
MLSEKRQEEILRLVNENHSVTVQELKELLETSESTIRRDIIALSDQGLLTKVFGGAVSLDTRHVHQELSVGQKESINREEKLQIAKYAASLIGPEDFVYIDSGTTTGFMIDFIHETGATYVTNAVAHAQRLVTRGCRVLLIGGELKETTEAIVGADALLNIQRYHFSKGFFGTNGISLGAGFTTPDVREAMVKQIAMQNTQAGSRYILADYEKFGQVSSVTFSGFDGVVTLTDRKPEDSYTEKMKLLVV